MPRLPLVFFQWNSPLLREVFVSLEVPGKNGMVSRDSPLAKAASICKLDALVTQADLSSDKEHAVGSCLVKHWGGR